MHGAGVDCVIIRAAEILSTMCVCDTLFHFVSMYVCHLGGCMCVHECILCGCLYVHMCHVYVGARVCMCVDTSSGKCHPAWFFLEQGLSPGQELG